MVGKYDVYLEYKDSGVSGLGGIPRHWQVMQLKRTVDGCVNGVWGADPTKDGSDTIVLRVADFDRPKLTIKRDGYTIRKIDEKDKLTRKLKPGDLLLEKSGGGAKTLVGQVVLFDGSFEAVTSNFVAKLTPHRGFNSRFLNYVFTRFYSDNINYCSIKQNTGIQNLDSAAYLAEKFGFPFVQEQQKIANFLDHETAKIDTLIEKQQQLIKLLKEKRQAVISHAVTKGLNPNAPMRDSGVEWLGEVPEHWNISKVKYLAELTPKKTEVEALKNKTCSFIPMEKLKKDLLILDETRQISQVFDGYTYFKDEDLLVAKVTPCFENKNMVVARGLHNGVGFGSSEIYVLRPNLESLNDFLYYRLQEDILMEMATGAMTGAGGLKRVPSVFLNNVQLALPPMKERLEIVEYIRGYVSKFDNLMKNSEYVIKLMQERRTALISAAVTGKIDVRNWQAPQPSNKSNNNTGK